MRGRSARAKEDRCSRGRAPRGGDGIRARERRRAPFRRRTVSRQHRIPAPVLSIGSLRFSAFVIIIVPVACAARHGVREELTKKIDAPVGLMHHMILSYYLRDNTSNL